MGGSIQGAQGRAGQGWTEEGRAGLGKVPPAPCPNTGQFWFRGPKCGHTGLPCLDKPVLLRGTYHRTQVADKSHPCPYTDYKRVHATQNTRAHRITTTAII